MHGTSKFEITLLTYSKVSSDHRKAASPSLKILVCISFSQLPHLHARYLFDKQRTTDTSSPTLPFRLSTHSRRNYCNHHGKDLFLGPSVQDLSSPSEKILPQPSPRAPQQDLRPLPRNPRLFQHRPTKLPRLPSSNHKSLTPPHLPSNPRRSNSNPLRHPNILPLLPSRFEELAIPNELLRNLPSKDRNLLSLQRRPHSLPSPTPNPPCSSNIIASDPQSERRDFEIWKYNLAGTPASPRREGGDCGVLESLCGERVWVSGALGGVESGRGEGEEGF